MLAKTFGDGLKYVSLDTSYRAGDSLRAVRDSDSWPWATVILPVTFLATYVPYSCYVATLPLRFNHNTFANAESVPYMTRLAAVHSLGFVSAPVHVDPQGMGVMLR